MKKNNISSRVLQKVMLISVVLLVFIVIVSSIFACGRIYSKETESMHNAIEKYTWSVENSISTAIERTAGITTWQTITDGLRRTDMTDYEKFMLSETIRSFMNNISNKEETEYKIYIANEFLYRDKYIKSLSTLENKQVIIANLKNNGRYLDPTVYSELGKQYIKLYIDAYWGDDSLVEVDIYMPTSDYDIELKQGTNAIGLDEISGTISETYVAVIKNKSQGMYMRMLYVVLFIVGMGMLALVILYIIMRSTISNTINTITNVLADLDGDMNDKNELIEIDEHDAIEVEKIKQIVNRLLEQVKTITAEKAEVDLEKRELNVYMLRKQLDPHTLYNSLAAVKLRAFKHNDEASVKIIDDLVTYYRAVLNKGSYYSTIGEEANLLEKFIVVSGAAREMHYAFNYSIEPGLEDVTIPQMLFHVFVENSIVHSFTPDTSYACIGMDVHSEDDYIVAIISNNGISMPNDKMLAINTDVQNAGYGIKNAFKRIQLYFGEDSTIHYSTNEPTGTIVEIKFKRKN